MQFHLYILYSLSSDKFYIGQTIDLERRLYQHNHSDYNSFTSKYRPWSLLTSIPFKSRALAMHAEKYLKKKPRDFIRRIQSDIELRNYIIEKFSANG